MTPISLGFGTHLPLLINAFFATQGKVLECGTGQFSTPVLHFLCRYYKRRLLSLESVKEYYRINVAFRTIGHEVVFIRDWNSVRFDTRYGLAFVDNKPAKARKEIIKKIADLADVIVLHDTQETEKTKRLYQYAEIYPLFKYAYHCKNTNTSLLSNFVDIETALMVI